MLTFGVMQLDHKSFSAEWTFKTSRSGGKGGQNVNKVSTKVLLEFNVAESILLTEEEKLRVYTKLASRITNEGILQIVSQTERSQLDNKDLAIEQFYKLLEKALKVEKPRKATKPTKSSNQKRLSTKKRDAEIKGLRKRVDD